MSNLELRISKSEAERELREGRKGMLSWVAVAFVLWTMQHNFMPELELLATIGFPSGMFVINVWRYGKALLKLKSR